MLHVVRIGFAFNLNDIFFSFPFVGSFEEENKTWQLYLVAGSEAHFEPGNSQLSQDETLAGPTHSGSDLRICPV